MVTSRLREGIAARLSPEATRAPTLVEQLTVTRLDWETLVRLNRYLSLAGKLATAVWVAFMASVIVGIDWRSVVEELINSGKPVRAAIGLVIVLPTLLFVVARSVLGLARWRVQRELWRRDVARLSPPDQP
jgi:hypothetical protein